MTKRNVCVLFGGVSPEHEVSLRSAECILNNIDRERNRVFAVGITRKGEWILYPGTDYSLLPKDLWMTEPDCCRCTISQAPRGRTPRSVRAWPISAWDRRPGRLGSS